VFFKVYNSVIFNNENELLSAFQRKASELN